MSGRGQNLRAEESSDAAELLAPGVGIFTPSVAAGELVAAGQSIGTLEVLGVRRSLLVPDGVAGRVTHRSGDARTRVPVQYGEALITVSKGAMSRATPQSRPGVSDTGSDLSFPAPMSGRFYGRPSPDEAPFVSAGDTVQRGQTVGLLEVMKTFNRLVYEGDGLPEEATIERVVPDDGDDVVRGDPVLLLGTKKG